MNKLFWSKVLIVTMVFSMVSSSGGFIRLALAGDPITDTDTDTFPDFSDNCPTTPNTDQANTDEDSKGNACDNCPNTINDDQADADGDGIGDACDLCPSYSDDTNQVDDDHDGIGNSCDNYNCISTGAEICNDQLDNDCDGYKDSADSDCANSPVTIVASKVICDNESDLPNWGAGSGSTYPDTVIGSGTAQNWVDQSQGKCRFTQDWNFEWAYENVSNPGDALVGPGGSDWNTFSIASPASISDLNGSSKIWVREVLQNNFIPFTGTDTSQTSSAEFYCHDDILNYDNYDYINNPQYQNTYYCVGFNAPSCGNGVKDSTEECEGTEGITPDHNFCSTTCHLIPIYHSDQGCPNGTVEGSQPIQQLSINGNDVDGETFNLTGGKSYLFRVSGLFKPNSTLQADAGYTLGQSQYGILGTGNDYAAHALLGNLGTNTVGVIDWGVYNSDHFYDFYYSIPSGSPSTQFVIGDRYSDWFDTEWQNQTGMSDNSDSLDLKVYECISENPTPTGDIAGYKYNDLNKDGNWDEQEPGLEGWNICIDGNKDGDCNDDGDNLQTTTNQEGFYSFRTLSVGTYQICEVMKGGWTSNSLCQEVVVTSGVETQANFFNYEIPTGSITACKYNDANQDGIYDVGTDTPLSWSIRLWYYPEGEPAGHEVANETTNQTSGCFEFDNLSYGTYTVHENQTTGWTQTAPTPDGSPQVVISETNSHPQVTFLNYNNNPTGSIAGYKINDLDRDGLYDSSDPDEAAGMNGWTIYLDLDHDEEFDQQEPYQTTDGGGFYRFENINNGDYQICEVMQLGWGSGDPLCQTVTVESDVQTQFDHEARADFFNYIVGWSEWGTCSVTCGGGTQTRTCADGAQCEGPTSRSCNTQSCGGGSSPTYTGNDGTTTTTTTPAAVAGASTESTEPQGEVLGASIGNCDLYLYKYIKLGSNNDPVEVIKLQQFLNEYLGLNLPVDGIYSQDDFNAVSTFQLAYKDEVLQPWVDAGLLISSNDSTGYVYRTTQRKINLIVCPELGLAMPDLTNERGGFGNYGEEGSVLGASTEATTTTTVTTATTKPEEEIVLGTLDETGKKNINWFLIFLGLIVIGGGLYALVLRKKK
ncbi:MAG: SdrD B-like domain-containing protein [Minisyncoccia bacterium]